MRVALVWLVPGFGVALAAQGLTWDLPPRGALVYARTTEEFSIVPPPTKLRPTWIVGNGASASPQEWRLLATQRQDVPRGFEAPGFDDSRWVLGRGEFGPDVDTNPAQHTRWASELLCVRARVDLGGKKPRALWFLIHHDDGVRVWLNGKLVVADDGYGRDRSYVVTGAALDAWQSGANVLAAQCTNTGGYQQFDLALAVFASLPAGQRSADDLLSALRTELTAATKVQSDLIGGFRPPALLLQGELDDRGQFVRIAPADLRELAGWMAMDLRCGVLGGAVQADAARMLRLGDLQVRGRATAVDPDGWQVLQLSVKNSAEPAPRGDSNRYVDRHVRPFVWYGFDGDLQVRRRLVVQNGATRVSEFSTTLNGRILRGKNWEEHVATVRQRESWRQTDVRENQDAEFRAMVAASLQRGTARVREQLRDLGGNDVKAEDPAADRSYHTGRLAIGLLALVKGGLGKDDEVVQRGYAELRRRTLVDSYSLANAIMAIEALYAPAGESGDLRTGTLVRPRPRTPSPEDKALLQQWTDQLLANVDSRVDPAYLLRFNYVRDARFDNSVHQYGLLGLYSAHLCGATVPSSVWEAAANHLLQSQSSGGERFELNLVDYKTLARRAADPEAKFTSSKTWRRANGWSYHEPKSDGEMAPTWGSMTCAGITGLAICEAALLDHPQLKRARLVSEITRAREDGFAWLAAWMTPRCHPGAIERQQHWYYYFLYSLERAALLAGVALIQDRDWYFEGAMMLVLAQHEDGNWPAELEWDLGIERNAMAILFLKQSTLPVLTGR